MSMWLVVLAMFTVLILALLGLIVFVMVVLHRKPNAASADGLRGRHRN
jgi:hypothetical protein